MIATGERPEVRVSVRVEAQLHEDLQKIADEKYEGKLAMAARAAFRLLINEDEQEDQAA